MPLLHTQLVAATDVILAQERALVFPHRAFADARARLDWLSEGDLMARLRDALVATGGCAGETTRIAAAGKTNKITHTNHDIECEGDAVEGVYCHSKSTSMPGKTLSGDLKWLLNHGNAGDHVVAFLPRVVSGFKSSGRSSSAYSTEGTKLTLAAEDRVFSDLVQVGGLDKVCWPLLRGLFARLSPPPVGKGAKWSLSAPLTALKHSSVERSVVGAHTDSVWAVVWSKV